MDDKVDSTAMGWMESLDELVKDVDTGVEEQEEFIETARSTVQKYVSDELKKDLPTG